MSNKAVENGLMAWRAFLGAYSTVIRELEREMQEDRGLALTWYDILAHLDYASEGCMRMQELAESVLLSRSGLTRLIDRMTEAGFVTRRPCPEDRRGMYAVITERGRAALMSAMPGHIAGIQEHFLRYLDGEDVCNLHAALSRVLNRGESAPSG